MFNTDVGSSVLVMGIIGFISADSDAVSCNVVVVVDSCFVASGASVLCDFVIIIFGFDTAKVHVSVVFYFITLRLLHVYTRMRTLKGSNSSFKVVLGKQRILQFCKERWDI